VLKRHAQAISAALWRHKFLPAPWWVWLRANCDFASEARGFREEGSAKEGAALAQHGLSTTCARRDGATIARAPIVNRATEPVYGGSGGRGPTPGGRWPRTAKGMKRKDVGMTLWQRRTFHRFPFALDAPGDLAGKVVHSVTRAAFWFHATTLRRPVGHCLSHLGKIVGPKGRCQVDSESRVEVSRVAKRAGHTGQDCG
jgi:hypothetical protein